MEAFFTAVENHKWTTFFMVLAIVVIIGAIGSIIPGKD